MVDEPNYCQECPHFLPHGRVLGGAYDPEFYRYPPDEEIFDGTWEEGLQAIEEFDWEPQFGDEEDGIYRDAMGVNRENGEPEEAVASTSNNTIIHDGTPLGVEPDSVEIVAEPNERNASANGSLDIRQAYTPLELEDVVAPTPAKNDENPRPNISKLGIHERATQDLSSSQTIDKSTETLSIIHEDEIDVTTPYGQDPTSQFLEAARSPEAPISTSEKIINWVPIQYTGTLRKEFREMMRERGLKEYKNDKKGDLAAKIMKHDEACAMDYFDLDKEPLLALLSRRDIQFSKSWGRDKLVEALIEEDRRRAAQFPERVKKLRKERPGKEDGINATAAEDKGEQGQEDSEGTRDLGEAPMSPAKPSKGAAEPAPSSSSLSDHTDSFLSSTPEEPDFSPTPGPPALSTSLKQLLTRQAQTPVVTPSPSTEVKLTASYKPPKSSSKLKHHKPLKPKNPSSNLLNDKNFKPDKNDSSDDGYNSPAPARRKRKAKPKTQSTPSKATKTEDNRSNKKGTWLNRPPRRPSGSRRSLNPQPAASQISHYAGTKHGKLKARSETPSLSAIDTEPYIPHEAETHYGKRMTRSDTKSDQGKK
ncbi:hypothetical protein K469DRAFT_687326 [Zopfia rhizophila CBS 207.26]|uniref:Uncharacterized protein n=1 Tax=Zopfia rhizophila CBS 207.26 TaxID=1314779 RepID=A0A6A6E857_9PEZI|nr:hypothetical protein K469DRAFT_687326 [Zopfia rhizophila CBS 207.26]